MLGECFSVCCPRGCFWKVLPLSYWVPCFPLFPWNPHKQLCIFRVGDSICGSLWGLWHRILWTFCGWACTPLTKITTSIRVLLRRQSQHRLKFPTPSLALFPKCWETSNRWKLLSQLTAMGVWRRCIECLRCVISILHFCSIFFYRDSNQRTSVKDPQRIDACVR